MASVEAETIGKELRLTRVNMGLTMLQMSERVGISENFISEIERDKKIPADEKWVYKIANAYKLDPTYLFMRFSKVPGTIVGEFSEFEELAHTLYKISQDKKLSDDKKRKLYRDFQDLYKEIKGD